MISFPNAKINIGLNITEKRPDGYHNLESCFYPIEWIDILEIVPSDSLSFSSSGISIPGNESSNLCLKAFDLLQKEHNIPPVNIHLHKVIPIGAGLGGGSSDGAFTLKMINEIFRLSLSINQLEAYAAELGSDCPFFIQNQPKFVTGTGDVFHEVKINLTGKHLIVIKPDLHVTTADAYREISPQHPLSNIKDVIENQSISTWKSCISNDFEQSIFRVHSSIAEIKKTLYKQGAVYASMTGSGAAVFGVFDKKPSLKFTQIAWEEIL